VAEAVDVEPAAVGAREPPQVSHSSGSLGFPRHEHSRSGSETRREERLDRHRDNNDDSRDTLSMAFCMGPVLSWGTNVPLCTLSGPGPFWPLCTLSVHSLSVPFCVSLCLSVSLCAFL
jgi:hypothetical protein